MAGFQNAPRRTGEDNAHWCWVPVRTNHKEQAWKGGKVVWIESHYVGRTVPCRTEMTQRALMCCYNHVEYPLEQRGYVPIITADNRRLLYIISDYDRDRVDAIPSYAAISILRGPNKKDPVAVLRANGVGKWDGGKTAPKDGFDVTPSLLRLWKDEEFARWCISGAARQREEDVIACQPIHMRGLLGGTHAESSADQEYDAVLRSLEAKRQRFAGIPPTPPPSRNGSDHH